MHFIVDSPNSFNYFQEGLTYSRLYPQRQVETWGGSTIITRDEVLKIGTPYILDYLSLGTNRIRIVEPVVLIKLLPVYWVMSGLPMFLLNPS